MFTYFCGCCYFIACLFCRRAWWHVPQRHTNLGPSFLDVDPSWIFVAHGLGTWIVWRFRRLDERATSKLVRNLLWFVWPIGSSHCQRPLITGYTYNFHWQPITQRRLGRPRSSWVLHCYQAIGGPHGFCIWTLVGQTGWTPETFLGHHPCKFWPIEFILIGDGRCGSRCVPCFLNDSVFAGAEG